jgi:lipoic acid synthetase
MLGMGETEEELLEVFGDLRATGCNYLSIGQYLAPSRRHYPVQEYVPPEHFNHLREIALELGFSHVESGPYVRSSYHAGKYV